jgi:hypothetical protein
MDSELRKRRLVVGGAVLALMALAGYHHFGRHHHWDGPVSINDDDDDKATREASKEPVETPVNINVDNDSGYISIKTPVFSGNVNIPGMDLGKGDVNFAGIKLYPGARITHFQVAGPTNDDAGKVELAFDAPAAPQAVHDYYANAFKEKGYALTEARAADAMSINAMKEDEESLALTLTPSGNATRGKMTISGGE